MDMDETNPTIKGRKPRSTRACYFCRFSRKSCQGHPYVNQQAEKCILCSVNDYPCGPYETAEETREFLKAVAHLHTIDGQINQRTTAVFGFADDRQPPHAELQLQNAGFLNTAFTPPDPASNIGSHNSQLFATPHASQESNDISVSGDGPPAANFTGSSVPQEARFTVLDSFTDLYSDFDPVDTPSEPQGCHMEEDDSAILSIFSQHDFLRIAQDYVTSEAKVLQSQELERERNVHYPIQHAIECIEKDLQRILEQMLTAFDDARQRGKVAQARWVCWRIERALEKTHTDRTQCLTEARRRLIFLKIHEFHTKYKDVSGADRISYELLQSDASSEPRALNLFADSIETSLERGFAETEHMGDIIPPFHRLAALGNAALLPILEKSAANGSVPRRDFIGQTIVHVAAKRGHTRLLGHLLDLQQSYPNFPSIEDRDVVGRTALYLAISHGKTEAYHLLISRGASLGVRDHAGHSPLTMASRGNHFAIVKDLILNRKCPVNERALHLMGGCQPLHAAAEGGCLEAVRVLLDNGADPQVLKLPGRKTAAQLARENGHPGVAAHIEDRSHRQGNLTLPGMNLPFGQGSSQ